MAEIKLVYVGNDHFQTIERLPDDSAFGSDYWACYIPNVILVEIGIVPEEHKLYKLNIKEERTG